MPVGPQRWCGIRTIVEWTAGVLACMSRGLADGTTPRPGVPETCRRWEPSQCSLVWIHESGPTKP